MELYGLLEVMNMVNWALGDNKDRNIPTKVDIDNVKQVVAGLYPTMFIKKMELYGLLEIIVVVNWVLVILEIEILQQK